MKAFYFPHDDNAAGDELVLKLRAKFGNTEGYALWFMLLEYLARNNGTIDADAMQELSICYSVSAEKWKDFIDECTRIGLLRENQHVKFNPRLILALKEREKKTSQAKKAANMRWDSQKPAHADAYANGNANAMLGEERRGEDKRYLKKPFNNEKKTTTTERTEVQTLLAFFDMALKNDWCEKTYRDAKMEQFQNLRLADKNEIKEKMDRTLNCTFSEKENIRKLARTMYHETVGLIQDRALDRKTIDGKTIAKRREFADESKIDTEPF